MDLSFALQQEVEQAAKGQGISPEQFILQAVTEKIDALKAQVDSRAENRAPGQVIGASHLREQDGMLVFDTESLDQIDFDLLLEQGRERSWESFGL